MLIAIVGGTGVAGRASADEALRRGHRVRLVSRHASVTEPAGSASQDRPSAAGSVPEFAAADLTTGVGLAEAFHVADVVINCSNTAATSPDALRAHFVSGTRRLVEAAAAAGVRRHVLLSIVGIEKVPMAYYRAKVAQEATAREGRVPLSVVRATQFHDFAGQIMRRFSAGPFAFVPRMRIQPVDTAEVARVLLDAAESAACVALWQVTGPREEDLVALARKTARAYGNRQMIVPVPLAGDTGRAIKAGSLLLPDGPAGGRDFAAWLAETAPGAALHG